MLAVHDGSHWDSESSAQNVVGRDVREVSGGQHLYLIVKHEIGRGTQAWEGAIVD